MVLVAITPSILLAIKHAAIEFTSSSFKSGAIFTATGTYFPYCSASAVCSNFNADNNSFNASPYCNERKPGVFGEEIFTVI